MSPGKLREKYRKHNPDGHFFDDATMKHWGDTMQNFGVRDDGEYWELERKQPVKNGLQSSHYFHKDTFEHITQMTYDRRMQDNGWSVVVGNIGQVYRGNEQEAREKFSRYVEQSKSGIGRAGGEDVSLWRETENDGDQPVEEFIGSISEQEQS